MPTFGVGLVTDEGLTVGASAEALPGVRSRAVRMVAHLSRDAVDCAQLLEAFGLLPNEGLINEETS